MRTRRTARDRRDMWLAPLASALFCAAVLPLSCGRPAVTPTPQTCPTPGPPPPAEVLANIAAAPPDLPGAVTPIVPAYAPQQVRWSGPEDAERQVLVIGSSSIFGALGKVIEADLAAGGDRVGRLGVSGTGLSRRDHYDWIDVARRLPVTERTRGVIVYLGVNDAQPLVDPNAARPPYLPQVEGGPKMRRQASRLPGAGIPWRAAAWQPAYEARVIEFADVLCDRGVHAVVLLLPVDVRTAPLDRALRRVRAAQTNAAARSKCALAVATEGDAPKFGGANGRLRRPDGFHMTPAGAEVVWQRVRTTVLTAIARETAP